MTDPYSAIQKDFRIIINFFHNQEERKLVDEEEEEKEVKRSLKEDS